MGSVPLLKNKKEVGALTLNVAITFVKDERHEPCESPVSE